MSSMLRREAASLAEQLTLSRKRIVLAESCTAGLASASLAGLAGISRWLCGSAVTYREQTKVDWLGVLPAVIEHSGVVSEVVAGEMASGVLARTPEADMAAAITGHLGPDAPRALDGVVYIALAVRSEDGTIHTTAWRHTLQHAGRLDRQAEAAALLLGQACQWLAQR